MMRRETYRQFQTLLISDTRLCSKRHLGNYDKPDNLKPTQLDLTLDPFLWRCHLMNFWSF